MMVVALAVLLSAGMAWLSFVLVTGTWFEGGQRFGMIVLGWFAIAMGVVGLWKLAK
jgi:hypothetical protein